MLDWLRRRLASGTFDEKADPARLSAIGRKVAERLRATDDVSERGGKKAELFLMPGFLAPTECARLIELIESNLLPSPLFSDPTGTGARTSQTHYFSAEEPEVAALCAKLDDLLGLERRHAETVQGQRYDVGQEYRHHRDFFRVEREHWQLERRRGGQRTWSAMVYLNAVEAGGETDFPVLDLSVAPEPGLLVAWNNVDRHGHPNPATLHAGMPVEAGRKYVVTQWYRMEDWCRSPRPAESD
ncbi:2OG-Fe(II) oxygenase [Qipengyuania aurantiaca]|uniref:2OG-Fe(II) oxygenase n=1 Tax=Qipengyuania aurantiaca TaxID=2867233 RepID=A0ABX8ZRU8_9SPHN|nr:2OG-Fe(II) oxygenase [Qipengyuania aurantiaca]QZD90494.1 2OG-Fe(II) oxygenase [Qipengyuania aurantiaca]